MAGTTALVLAQEKHDDEDIREINVQLEATTAIVARQTRDWMVFQQESAELSRKRTKTMESLMAHSLGDCPPPYLANYSEDSGCLLALQHVAADGEEHSLGSGASCSFRLPPSLGVCDITGYIRNEEGRLWLRPEPLPHSTRPASIEVNGEKLSLEPLELQHLVLASAKHLQGTNVFCRFTMPGRRKPYAWLRLKMYSVTRIG
eukprot:s97_g13.t1